MILRYHRLWQVKRILDYIYGIKRFVQQSLIIPNLFWLQKNGMKWNDETSPGRVRVEPTVNKQNNNLFSSSRHPYFWRKNSQNKTRQRQWHPIKLCGSPIRSPDSFNIDPIWYLYAHIGLYIIGIVFLLMCVCGIVLQRSVYIRCLFFVDSSLISIA